MTSRSSPNSARSETSPPGAMPGAACRTGCRRRRGRSGRRSTRRRSRPPRAAAARGWGGRRRCAAHRRDLRPEGAAAPRPHGNRGARGPERDMRAGERQRGAEALAIGGGSDDRQAAHARHPGSLGSARVRKRSASVSAISSLPALSSPKGTIARIVSSAARLPITPVSAPSTPCSAQLMPGLSGSAPVKQR